MLNESLTDSWNFFKNHVVPLSLIVVPIEAPIAILTAIYQYFVPTKYEIFPVVIECIAYPIYTIAAIFYIASVISGANIDTKTLLKLGVKLWFPYVVLSIAVGIVVLFGLVLLIIPGIIFAIRYVFSEFYLLLNDKKPLDAMRSSWNATKNYMWILIGGYAVITLALYMPYYLVSLLFDKSGIIYLILDTVLNIVYSVLGVIYVIFAFRIYELENSKQPAAKTNGVRID